MTDDEWAYFEPFLIRRGGRPPRKYYRLTAEGVRVARLELAHASAQARRAAQGTAARPVQEGTR